MFAVHYFILSQRPFHTLNVHSDSNTAIILAFVLDEICSYSSSVLYQS